MRPRPTTLLIAGTLLFLLFSLPSMPAGLSIQAFLTIPLEWIAVVALIVAVSGKSISKPIRFAISLLITTIVVLKIADLVSHNALSRSFNPVADMALVDAFVRLTAGTFGTIAAAAAVVGAVISVAVVFWVAWWSLSSFAKTGVSRPLRVGALTTVIIATGLSGAKLVGHGFAIPAFASISNSRYALDHIVKARATIAELVAFQVAAVQDRFSGRSGLLTAIDRDVFVIFIESYGRASFDTPLYSDLHPSTLASYEEKLRSMGVASRSGFLTAPTRGGQSWLSHATFSNGLWVNNQVSYRAVLASGRKTLFHHAADSGYHTAAVMPQITLEWPESARMGFETIFEFEDLDYQGPAFNWVTMPDQFTLSAMDRLLVNNPEMRGDGRPLFVQAALVSSHAPWVPVPEIIPWDEVGDGAIFTRFTEGAPTPREVWSDRDRVRAQYRLAVDYALQSVMEYALLHADDPPLLIVVGDHQAADFVSRDESADVPIHVLGPAHLVEPLAGVAPTAGLVPGKDLEAQSMEVVRDAILSSFTAPTAAELTRVR
ncbi:MAG: sulfatase-like hydrolase/transferase [Pseudomonadota bacterium]